MNRRYAWIIVALVVIPLAGCGNDTVDRAKDKKSSSKTAETPGHDLEDGANPYEPGSLVGESVEDFPDTNLVNEQGEPVSFETLPDSPVLMSFIYTRCPMPKMCPLITYKMRQVQKRLNRSGNRPVHFVSVTFDPTYDTPAVLRRYGNKRNVDYANWDFWTGPAETIRSLTVDFKIFAKKPPKKPKQGKKFSISHNMRTYLIDENRRVRYWYRGSEWKISDVTRRLKQMVSNN
ncbi:MAG: SCO family protein [bacterium]